MGLDKGIATWLNKSMRKILEAVYARLIHGGKVVRKSPITLERERFLGEMKEQFVQLKEKGLGITVFTLWPRQSRDIWQ